MAKFVRVFITPTHRRLLSLCFWLVSFTALLCTAGWYSLYKTTDVMHFEAKLASDHFREMRQSLLSTFEIIQRDLTATPCSPEFNKQLRRIAYLPDGLSEFLYAPNGQVQCSTTILSFEPTVNLGVPHIVRGGPQGGKLWVNHDLGFLGLDGERGSIVLNGAIAAVVPVQTAAFPTPRWLSIEAVMRGDTGEWWHRGGVKGTYDKVNRDRSRWFLDERLRTLSCGGLGLHCIAARVDVRALIADYKFPIAAALLVMILLATFLTREFSRLLRQYWSFEARFRRYLDADSVVCAYQPVMSLETGEITGCEVLARWRDIDDSIVFPDRFLRIIEKHQLTLRFTELVAQRACAELSEFLPLGRKLQVNFNIFPRDLDSAQLSRVYSGFTTQPERFDVVLEIIESDEIPANAQCEIELLRANGLKTYIDDFGSGYSNMQNLAALSVDGVKLDRAFAMAPENSMMARMLHHAIDMVHATGRVMVVEGVETAERLALLRGMQERIDFVQGYFISRPLPIDAFIAYLNEGSVSEDCPVTTGKVVRVVAA